MRLADNRRFMVRQSLLLLHALSHVFAELRDRQRRGVVVSLPHVCPVFGLGGRCSDIVGLHTVSCLVYDSERRLTHWICLTHR